MGLKSISAIFIAKRGQTASMIIPGEEIPDGAGGTITGDPTLEAVKVIVTSFDAEEVAAYGGLIAPDDLRVYVSNDPAITAPSTEYEIDIGGTVYRIIRVSQFAPDGNPILYDLTVRDD